MKTNQINLDLRFLEFNAKIINTTISYGEWTLGIILSTSIKMSKKLAGNNHILKKAVKFMKVFETDKLKAKEDGKVIGSEKKAVENAKNSLDNDTILKITGLSIKEIVALK